MADNYLKDQIKENFPQTSEKSHPIPQLEFRFVSAITESISSTVNFQKESKEGIPAQGHDSEAGTKLKPSTQAKRKPVVKDREVLRLIKKPNQPSSARETCAPKESKPLSAEQPQAASSRKMSNSYILKPNIIQKSQISEVSFESVKGAEIVAIADRFAEKLSSMRDSQSLLPVEERNKVYFKIEEFCAYCTKRSDDELKQLVVFRLGSYLNAMIYLLHDISDSPSPRYQMCLSSLKQLLDLIKRKTFNYVASPHRSLLGLIIQKKRALTSTATTVLARASRYRLPPIPAP